MKNPNDVIDRIKKQFEGIHVLPYFREFVTSVTQRLPVPPVYIPPTNIKALLAEYEQNNA